MPRVLLVKLGAIGDVLMLLPAAHALHQAGWAVEWLCGAQVAPLLELFPWIDLLVADEAAFTRGSAVQRLRSVTKQWPRLARRRYDLIATLYYDPRYRLLTLPARARRRLSLSPRGRATRLLPGRHHTDEYARILLSLPDDVRPSALAPVPPAALPPSPLPPSSRSRVVLLPGGARNALRDDALRRWPVESYAALARALAPACEVVLAGGADDRWVLPLFAGLDIVDCIGRCSLLETLGLLGASDLLVTHDTGPLHLAGLTPIGIVSVFGPTDPHARLPQRPGALAIWGGEGFACRSCYDGRDYAACHRNDCIRQVTPAMVLAQIHALLDDRRTGQLRPARVLEPSACPEAPLDSRGPAKP